MEAHSSHILVIDDDTRIRTLLKKYLEEHGFCVSTANSAEEAYNILEFFLFDLLIVDVMMPGDSGIEFTAKIRTNSAVPILMLTAMGEVEQRIEGLESGADDYLPKPFEPRELLLRIERILGRIKQQQPEPGIMRLGNLEFNLRHPHLSRNGEAIPLTSTEEKLLTILCERPNIPLSRDTLAELCGGVNARTIDVQIIRLRQKIEPDPKKPLYLKTVRGEGYLLAGV